MNFNPKLTDFLKDHKDITLISIFWSCYWRFCVMLMAGAFIIGFIQAL